MTTKELAEWYRRRATNDGNYLHGSKIYERTAEILESLEPRTEPPTVAEVGEYDNALFLYADAWEVYSGSTIRGHWRNGKYWLPLPSLPQPKETE